MFNSLPEWLRWLDTLHPQEIDLTLDRIQRVAYQLKLTLQSFVITVAGTNGKGSCVALLESILKEAHYRVGAYFSPHLISFNERIRLLGQEVTDEQVCESFKIINHARGETTLTYFEFTTLAALYLFQEAQLDFILLEVGLGGQFDAVNIIPPDIAIISSISLDHIELLGHTRELIGKEKAGIFRENRIAISGDNKTPQSILDAAKEKKCRLSCQGKDFYFVDNKISWDFFGNQILKNLPYPIVELQNAATVLQALTSLPIKRNAIEQGLKKINLKGRFQKIKDNPTVILDVAHNPAAANLLATNLKKLNYKKIHALVGMLKDKDHHQSLFPLISLIDSWYVASLSGKRGASAEYLATHVNRLTQNPVFLFSTVNAAYDAVLHSAQADECIIVFGSFLTVGAVLQHENS